MQVNVFEVNNNSRIKYLNLKYYTRCHNPIRNLPKYVKSAAVYIQLRILRGLDSIRRQIKLIDNEHLHTIACVYSYKMLKKSVAMNFV